MKWRAPRELGMAADDFFARWSKKKVEAQAAPTVAPAQETSLPQTDLADAATDREQRLPTLEDVEQLTPQADFSAFMTQGVDEGVRRAAMKKLFSDPHFNVMDGLDVYIEDYNSFEALTPDVIATLNHAKALLDPLSQCSAPTMSLLDTFSEDDAPNAQTESIASVQQPTAEPKPVIESSTGPADETKNAESSEAKATDPQVNEPDASHSQP
jgi:hypothetical protein